MLFTNISLYYGYKYVQTLGGLKEIQRRRLIFQASESLVALVIDVRLAIFLADGVDGILDRC